MKKIIVLSAILLNLALAAQAETAKQNLAPQPENLAENSAEPTAKDEALPK